MKNVVLSTLAITLVPFAALASTTLGNPTSGITLVAGGTVHLEGIRAYECSGGFTDIGSDTTLSKGMSVQMVYPEALYCDLDVFVRLSPSGPVEVIPVDGFTSLKVVNGASAFGIDLDSDSETATLN